MKHMLEHQRCFVVSFGHRAGRLTPGGGAPCGSATPGGEVRPPTPTPGGTASPAVALPAPNRFLSGILPAGPRGCPPSPVLVLDTEAPDRSRSDGAAAALRFFFCAAVCARKASCGATKTDTRSVSTHICTHTHGRGQPKPGR